MSDTRSLNPAVWAGLVIYAKFGTLGQAQNEIASTMADAHLPRQFNIEATQTRLMFWENQFKTFDQGEDWIRDPQYAHQYYLQGLDEFAKYIGDVQVPITYDSAPMEMRFQFWLDVVTEGMRMVQPKPL